MSAAPPSSPPPAPCGLTQEVVLALDERNRVPVVGGRCQNGYADAEGDHICNQWVGSHPKEIAPSARVRTSELDINAVNDAISQSKNPVDDRAYASYLDVGEKLDNSTLLSDISAARKCDSKYFFLVDGPSGIGKTQLVFFLRAHGYKVVHILMTIPHDSKSVQPIYQYNYEISKLFIAALEKDVGKMNQVDLLMDYEYETVTFLSLILGAANPGSCTIASLRTYVISEMKDSDVPLFVLDEVLTKEYNSTSEPLPSNHPEVKRLRFARNLLKSVGITAFLMGTNSCAANYISSAMHSRCSGDDIMWCKLITRLPRASEKSLQCLGAIDALASLREYEQLREFFSTQFLTALPWFAELFVQAITAVTKTEPIPSDSVSMMDALLLSMANMVFKRKPSLRSREGLRGQVCMNLSSHMKNDSIVYTNHQSIIARPTATYFVGCHFARLLEESGDLFVSESKLMKKDGEHMEVWRPRTFFPNACDDGLLYLLLGGGKKDAFPPPFLHPDDRNILSTHAALLHLQAAYSQDEANSKTGFENTSAPRRDGDILEVLCTLSMQMASHRHGLSGVPFHEFIRLVFLELLIDSDASLQWTEAAESFLLDSFAKGIVPYMSPCNNPWRDSLKCISGCNVADLHRTKNSDRIDMKVGNLTGESKNYEKEISTKTLAEMLKRIPDDSRYHLIFCSKLQRSYFTGKKQGTWAFFSGERIPKPTNIVKVIINKQTNKLEYKPLCDQIPVLGEYDRLVVIFEVDNISSVVAQSGSYGTIDDDDNDEEENKSEVIISDNRLIKETTTTARKRGTCWSAPAAGEEQAAKRKKVQVIKKTNKPFVSVNKKKKY